MFMTLSRVGALFNAHNVLWGVGASLLLQRHGLAERANDIDLLIGLDDIRKADDLLQSVGVKKQQKNAAAFSTRFFYEYEVDGFDIDLMAGLRINHSAGVYEFVFDRASIPDFEDIGGTAVPFMALEDWYVLYLLMPHKEHKAQMLEAYLRAGGIRNPLLLERALRGCLPKEVRESAMRVLCREG